MGDVTLLDRSLATILLVFLFETVLLSQSLK
jgi:hypothetical protein